MSVTFLTNEDKELIDLEISQLSDDIADLKENGTGTGNGATTAQANSLWVIIQKSAFAQQLTDAEINAFKTEWGIEVFTIPCTGITLNKTTLSFADNTSQTLTATVEPSNTTDKVVWKSSNTSVATVTNGVVKPLSNGSCTITATCGSVSATCSVTVNIAEEEQVTLSSISATYNGGNVAVGTSVNSLTGITVTGTYSDGSTSGITGYTLSGEIVEGSNTITVSYGGKTTTFTVIGVAESGDSDVVTFTPTWTKDKTITQEIVDYTGWYLSDEIDCSDVNILWLKTENNHWYPTPNIYGNSTKGSDTGFLRVTGNSDNNPTYMGGSYSKEVWFDVSEYECFRITTNNAGVYNNESTVYELEV